MTPFRTSITARVVSGAVAFALIGGGLIAAAGISAPGAIPIVLLLSMAGTLVGLLLGVYEHSGPVTMLAILAPLAFWPYVLLLQLVVTRAPIYGWALIAAGLVVAGASVIASYTLRHAPVSERPTPSTARG